MKSGHHLAFFPEQEEGVEDEEEDNSQGFPNFGTSTVFLGLQLALVILVVVVFKVVMSTKKKSVATCKPEAPKRVKKVRSISVSVDLEGYDKSQSKLHRYFTRSSEERFRTVSACVTESEYGEQYPGIADGIAEGENGCTPAAAAALRLQQRHRFPFQDLPHDCQLKIFQFLTPAERGIAAQVCTQWKLLIKSSSLWSTVDFAQFPLCYDNNHDCGKICYIHYRSRIRKFIKFLQMVRPSVKKLSFAFDIDDHEDGWLEAVETFLKAANLRELEYVHMNWAETPVKPYWGNANITWTASDYNALKFKNRHRQRLFVNFFDKFTAAAPNIGTLILPFDWSPRSLVALSRLSSLHTLVLGKYFENQQLSQECVDQLLNAVPQLNKLILEVWSPSVKGVNFYTIKSPTLPYLDITQCRGFYISHVDLPSLKVFQVGLCHPLKGPLTCSQNSVNIPCIYQVLVEGAPKLKRINEHTLLPRWRWDIYPELQLVLEAVCSCRHHKNKNL